MKTSNQKTNVFTWSALLIIFISLSTFNSSCKKDKDESKRVEVIIEDTLFNPSVSVIPAGGTVIWENDGNLIHTVTSDSSLFNSGDIAPNGTFSFTFDEAGTYNYHCVHHSGMTGTVLVQ